MGPQSSRADALIKQDSETQADTHRSDCPEKTQYTEEKHRDSRGRRLQYVHSQGVARVTAPPGPGEAWGRVRPRAFRGELHPAYVWILDFWFPE